MTLEVEVLLRYCYVRSSTCITMYMECHFVISFKRQVFNLVCMRFVMKHSIEIQ